MKGAVSSALKQSSYIFKLPNEATLVGSLYYINIRMCCLGAICETQVAFDLNVRRVLNI